MNSNNHNLCKVCNRRPMIGSDESSSLVHSLSGLRSLIKTRNIEKAKATMLQEKGLEASRLIQNKANIINTLNHDLKVLLERKEKLTSDIDHESSVIANLNKEVDNQKKMLLKLRATYKDMDTERSILDSTYHVVRVNYLNNLKKAVSARRFRAALELFICFPIVSAAFRQSMIRGYSTICGIPLPNTGNYGGIPHEIISSALGLVAHLVDMLSAVLNINLPHPLKPFANASYATVGVFSNASMSHLALSPILMSTKGDSYDNPNFDTAHEMLAANIVHLCLTLRLEPESLYPARSLLLNLLAIHTCCMDRTEENMSFMQANISSSATDPRSEEDSLVAAELVNSLVRRYRNLERSRGGMSATKAGDAEWLLVDNEDQL